MFTNITWGTYLSTVAVAFALWYVIVGAKFYYYDIKGFLNGKRKSHFQHIYPEGQQNPAYNPSQATEQASTQESVTAVSQKHTATDFEVVEELVERVKGLVSNAVEHNTIKEDFLPKLRAILADYPSLKQSQFRDSINEFIVSEGEQQGLVSITEKEVEPLWDPV